MAVCLGPALGIGPAAPGEGHRWEQRQRPLGGWGPGSSLGGGREGHVPDPSLAFRSSHRPTQMKVGNLQYNLSGCGGGLGGARSDSQLQPRQQPPMPQGVPVGFWLLGSLGVGGHQLSGWPGGWHVALASTGFAEGWRVPALLPRAWAQWGSGQDWGMKGAGHWPGRPSGSDLRNSRPRWPARLFLTAIITGSALASGTMGSGHR